MAMRYTHLGNGPLLVLIGALAPLAVAFGAQYLGGLAPCELCIWQRWGYGAVAAFAVLALLAASASKAQQLLVLLGGVAAFATAVIAIFHVGVEQRWWQGFTECTGPVGAGMTAEEFAAAILNAPVVRCDEIAWSFAGISIAGYNVVYGIALGIFAIFASRARRQRTPA